VDALAKGAGHLGRVLRPFDFQAGVQAVVSDGCDAGETGSRRFRAPCRAGGTRSSISISASEMSLESTRLPVYEFFIRRARADDATRAVYEKE